ncbi:MAG: putative toxin-antitoxin system toxin component, PIN family [Thermomicrobiales bacterium]
MPRVVLDANVWVSAALKPESIPGHVVQMVRSAEVESVISRALLDQVLRTLKRLRLSDERFQAMESVVFRRSTRIEPTFRLAVITAKASDNRVLECAVAGGVDYIVTGDRKHLLRLGQYEGIPIISPREFIDSVRS